MPALRLRRDDLVPGRRRALRMAWYDLRRWLAMGAKRGGERLSWWLWP